MSVAHARLATEPFDPATELAELTSSSGNDGAIVSFVGLARAIAKSGDVLKALVLEDHPLLTPNSLTEIAKAALERFPVSRVRIVHRSGDIAPGEPIVFAGVASAHRRDAFEAADYLMDRLKTEAVFWKREKTASGTAWIEPTEADYADRGRWE
jgi:molybdopterin synthase catalytic subunit